MTVEVFRDQQRAERFAAQMIGTLNAGTVTLMMSVGHRVGLFDTMSGLAPATSEEIADAAGLDERYVREWLAAMVTSGIVEHDAATGTYSLPVEHAMFLTRAAGADNLAHIAQIVGMLGTVEDRVIDCFRNGGGVPYQAYARFHEFMAEDSRATVAEKLVDVILPVVPGLTAKLQEGIDVVDLGCGRGQAMIALAKAFPRSRFAGYDLSEEAIGEARAEAAAAGLRNVRFEVRDVATLDGSQRFALVTAFDAIHDQAYPAAVLANVAAMLEPGGTFLMQDIAGSSRLEKNLDHPFAPYLYTVSCMHCMTVSLAQGGVGLGTMWGEELATQMLGDAGFGDVRVERLAHDPLNLYYVARA
ncbi:MAG: class I SAM-dependent methyltransferase [Thermoanaerobaculia bacterium]